MKKIIPTRRTALRLLVVAIALSLVAGMSIPALADTGKSQTNKDGYVTGSYTAYYYSDADGDWYWDLSDGRTQGTVDSVADLNQSTLTTYTYHIQYRADFGDDPYMDDGWIRQTIHGEGYAGNSVTTYLIVSDEDPRHTGNPDRAVWGSWEYVTMTVDGEGNVANPLHPEYAFE